VCIGEVVNIGSNYEISIKDTAELIADVMGKKIHIIGDEVRVRPDQSEVERLWASNVKAERLLGWRPVYAGRDGFKKGLEITVNWFTNPDNLKRYKSDLYNI
jgi:nucleoside-diphosphate-sugar epimerase